LHFYSGDDFAQIDMHFSKSIAHGIDSASEFYSIKAIPFEKVSPFVHFQHKKQYRIDKKIWLSIILKRLYFIS